MDKNLLSLYLVTDRGLDLGRPLEWVVREAVLGGVTMVQLREKDADTRDFVELAVRVKEVLSGCGRFVPLIINDRLDVAMAADADGVHIGQSDMPYSIARRLLGPGKIIGLSVENMEQVMEAQKMDVDYIAASPVYSTGTKTDTAEPFGLEGVRRVAALTRHPLVGIGRMNALTAGDVIRAGADGVAVVSAIVGAESPRDAAAELIKIITEAK